MAGVRRRFADAGWSVIQTPVAAGLAWFIAHTLHGHAARVRALAAHPRPHGPQAQLIARLLDTCAGDILLMTASSAPPSRRRPRPRWRPSPSWWPGRAGT
jgi:hypothetical protein